MKGYYAIALLALTCRSPSPQSAKERAVAADSLWKARVRSSACRRPAYATSNWPAFLTAKGTATIRIPPFLGQDQFRAAPESAKVKGQRKLPPNTTRWYYDDSHSNLVDFSLDVEDSVKLAYAGVPEREESICVETIDGAQATVLAYTYKRGATGSNGAALGDRGRAAGDTASARGPYFVTAAMRFPDGLALEIDGAANTIEQQNQMLAAIRTIRRVSNRP
jgi:hypothetical protein